jgi:hypothetical protein
MTSEPPGYEFIHQLGQGAMGTVSLARRVATGQEVAIKRIVGGASSQDPETVRRFEREARLLAQLDSPGIVRVHELLRVGADLVVVMEHVPGGDLRGALAAGPPTPERAVHYVADIAEALDHAHARGVLHRDVKPSNVLLRRDGVTKLSDFGLAALLERQARFAARGAAAGTPAYMAPELARGDQAVDSRADVYSLGAIAFEMLVGRVPFPVDALDVYATVQAQMEQPPPRPSGLVPGFPPLLEAALLWALQKQPERRPATAGELATALREALERSPTEGTAVAEEAPVAADRNGATKVVTLGGWRAASTTAAPEVEASQPGSTDRRRSPWPAWRTAVVLAIAGLAVGAGLGGWAARALPPVQAAALQVTGVTAAVEPADGIGHCPRATMTVRAFVATNGAAGTISYQWLRPGGATAPAHLTVPGSTRRTAVTMAVDYSGAAPAEGLAALHVLSPASVYSPPVQLAYTCP